MVLESNEYKLTDWNVAGARVHAGPKRRVDRSLNTAQGYLWIPCRISQTWMQGVCSLGLRGERAAIVILGLASRRRSMTIDVQPGRLVREGWPLDARCLNRGVRDLEQRGFVHVERRSGKALRVTILDPPSTRVQPTDVESRQQGESPTTTSGSDAAVARNRHGAAVTPNASVAA